MSSLLAEPQARAAPATLNGHVVPAWVLDTWLELLEYLQRREAEWQAANEGKQDGQHG